MFIFENVSKTSASYNDLFVLTDQTNVLALKVFAFSFIIWYLSSWYKTANIAYICSS